MNKLEITVDGITIGISNDEFINIGHMANIREERSAITITTWMNTKNTIRYLKAWEEKNNVDFVDAPRMDFAGFRAIQDDFFSGQSSISPSKWINYTNASGIRVERGRYGGIWAHQEIAFEFATWLDPQFKVWVYEEFKRLKKEEHERLADPFRIERLVVMTNHHLLMSTILDNIHDKDLKHALYEGGQPFAAEMDMLNKIVFGHTAKNWEVQNPTSKVGSNQRDYATIQELTALANLLFLNAMFIKWDMSIEEREDYLMDAHKWMDSKIGNQKSLKELKRIAERFKKGF